MIWAARALQWYVQHAFLLRKGLVSSNAYRVWNRPLQFLVLNEEFLVSASHQLALITSLPFVHTARRSYRLSGPVNNLDRCLIRFSEFDAGKSSEPYHLEEGEVVTRFP